MPVVTQLILKRLTVEYDKFLKSMAKKENKTAYEINEFLQIVNGAMIGIAHKTDKKEIIDNSELIGKKK